MHATGSFEAQLSAQGYQTITTISRDASYALGEHSHPFDACALITSGSITLQVGELKTTYSAGSVFKLARDTPHHEWAGEQGVVYVAGRRT